MNKRDKGVQINKNSTYLRSEIRSNEAQFKSSCLVFQIQLATEGVKSEGESKRVSEENRYQNVCVCTKAGE